MTTLLIFLLILRRICPDLLENLDDLESLDESVVCDLN